MNQEFPKQMKLLPTNKEEASKAIKKVTLAGVVALSAVIGGYASYKWGGKCTESRILKEQLCMTIVELNELKGKCQMNDTSIIEDVSTAFRGVMTSIYKVFVNTREAGRLSDETINTLQNGTPKWCMSERARQDAEDRKVVRAKIKGIRETSDREIEAIKQAYRDAHPKKR